MRCLFCFILFNTVGRLQMIDNQVPYRLSLDYIETKILLANDNFSTLTLPSRNTKLNIPAARKLILRVSK